MYYLNWQKVIKYIQDTLLKKDNWKTAGHNEHFMLRRGCATLTPSPPTGLLCTYLPNGGKSLSDNLSSANIYAAPYLKCTYKSPDYIPETNKYLGK